MSKNIDIDAWGALQPYLEKALELEGEERANWMAKVHVSEPLIGQQLTELLAKLDSLDQQRFLEAPAIASAGLEELVDSHEPKHSDPQIREGAELGPYRLIREIGKGGMSAVWLAERSDEHLKRQVALKLPYIQSPHHRLAERFKRERDILACLTHPHIGRLYDAGASASGQLFLAMEHVEGLPLGRYCDGQRMKIAQRLDVFQQVLDAVQYAHSQLILHRDLKPSNILVTAQGRVVLLDFGIAKILSADETAAQLTQFTVRAFTPQYASPEQIGGQPLSTASDIYSLGVLLYELLCGQLPYRPRRPSAAALEDAIASEAPPPMSHSSALDEVAAERATTGAQLSRALRGDLDTIVLKCLQKKPEDRYRTAAELAQDIASHLRNEPIRARPESRWYRLGRFARRYRIPVAAATVALVAIIGGGSLALWQSRIAAQERDRAVVSANHKALVTQFFANLLTTGAGADKPVSISELVTRGEKSVLSDSTQAPDDRALLLAQLAGYHMSVGDVAAAMPLIDRAEELTRRSNDAELRSSILCERAFESTKAGHVIEGVRELDAVIQQYASRVQIPDCLQYRAYAASDEEDAALTVNYSERALEAVRSTGLTGTTAEANALGTLARGYYQQGRPEDADRYFRRAVSEFDGLGMGSSHIAITIRNNWAIVLDSAGMPRESLNRYDDILERLENSNPDASLPPFVVGNRAHALEDLGRFDAALQAYSQALQLAQELNLLPSELYSLTGAASVEIQLGNLDSAASHLAEAQHLLDASSIPAEASPAIAQRISTAQLELARKNPHQAAALLENIAGSSLSLNYKVNLTRAEIALATNDGNGATGYAQAALKIAQHQQGGLEYSARSGRAWLALARGYQALGNSSAAQQAVKMAVLHLEHTVDDNQPSLAEAHRLLVVDARSQTG